MDFNKTNYYLKNIEYGLGFAAVIPGLKVPAALGQALLGKTQIITGLSLGAFYSISSLFQKNLHEEKEKIARAIYSLTYAKHGLLNIGRSIATLIPLVNYILFAKDGVDALLQKEKYRKFDDISNARLVYNFKKFFSKTFDPQTNDESKLNRNFVFNNDYLTTHEILN